MKEWMHSSRACRPTLKTRTVRKLRGIFLCRPPLTDISVWCWEEMRARKIVWFSIQLHMNYLSYNIQLINMHEHTSLSYNITDITLQRKHVHRMKCFSLRIDLSCCRAFVGACFVGVCRSTNAPRGQCSVPAGGSGGLRKRGGGGKAY